MTVLKFIELVAIIGTLLGLYFHLNVNMTRRRRKKKRFNALHKDIKDTQTSLEIKDLVTFQSTKHK